MDVMDFLFVFKSTDLVSFAMQTCTPFICSVSWFADQTCLSVEIKIMKPDIFVGR